MEKILTKYFWVFNLVTLAAVAYLLADGTGEIIAASVSEKLPSTEEKAGPRRLSSKRQKTVWTSPDGSDILSRNIFDSTVGPIGESDDEIDTDIPEEQLKGDLQIVPCSGNRVKLLATVASKRNIEWSFASVVEGTEGKLCRVGDELDNRTVSGITWRYLFLRGSADECYVDLFGDKDAKTPPKRPAVAKKREGPSGEDDLKAGIQKISDTERIVDRSMVDKLLTDPTKFIRSVRVRPHKKNGKVVGFKLRRFRNNSPLALLGAKKGDIIHSVNGTELNSVDQALAVYQNLRSASDLTFSITRRGKPVELKINIR